MDDEAYKYVGQWNFKVAYAIFCRLKCGLMIFFNEGKVMMGVRLSLKTKHQLLFQDSRKLDCLEDESINLVVTSPPYPMIGMWDENFAALNKEIKDTLEEGDYRNSFELMHQELDKVWKELYRVLKTGGFACINIGDATRTIGGRFQLFCNHYRILQAFWENDFDVIPVILWRKQTNAPNKFMGSGMLPAGAYVTLEHEYILIFRKGPKRNFKSEAEKVTRQESAIFWEERNHWYSDFWEDFKGTRQDIGIINGNGNLRKRSGAYPFLLPYRLINMYSVYGDTVLDPFLGTGTTTLAALACGRNSVGCEIDSGFFKFLDNKLQQNGLIRELNQYHRERIQSHKQFVEQYSNNKGHQPKYKNQYFEFPVVTRQEILLKFMPLKKIMQVGDGCYHATYGTPEELNMEKDIASNDGRNNHQLQIFK